MAQCCTLEVYNDIKSNEQEYPPEFRLDRIGKRLRILTTGLTFTQNLSSSIGSPSMISSGKVTSKGSGRDSNGPSKVTGRAISPRSDADNPRRARLSRLAPARVAATGSWKFKGMAVARRCPFRNLQTPRE
jgi:hypothetical protein